MQVEGGEEGGGEVCHCSLSCKALAYREQQAGNRRKRQVRT